MIPDILRIMNSRPPVDKAFSRWLVQRSLKSSSTSPDPTHFSIAIESPCSVCQPRVAMALALYLNEFDDSENQQQWLPVTDHRIEQLQAHEEFREILRHETPNDPDSAIDYLSHQGCVILELPKCHAQTADNPQVFQVSMSCQEPSEGNHHLWINAKRMPEETLVPMIANAFLDWSCNGGDRKTPKAQGKKNS